MRAILDAATSRKEAKRGLARFRGMRKVAMVDGREGLDQLAKRTRKETATSNQR
jgi:hypothetical protein